MRPIRVIAPRGLIVNPNPPAPVCMSTNHCGEEIIEAIFKALAPAVPQVVSAGFSRRLRFAMSGRDPRTGRQFIWHFFHARGGGFGDPRSRPLTQRAWDVQNGYCSGQAQA